MPVFAAAKQEVAPSARFSEGSGAKYNVDNKIQKSNSDHACSTVAKMRFLVRRYLALGVGEAECTADGG